MKNRDSHEDSDKNDLILVLNFCLDLPCGFCVIAGVNPFLLFRLLVLLSVFIGETFCFCTNPKEVSFTASNIEESDLDDDVKVDLDDVDDDDNDG